MSGMGEQETIGMCRWKVIPNVWYTSAMGNGHWRSMGYRKDLSHAMMHADYRMHSRCDMELG